MAEIFSGSLDLAAHKAGFFGMMSRFGAQQQRNPIAAVQAVGFHNHRGVSSLNKVHPAPHY